MKSRQRKPIEMRIEDPTHEGEINLGDDSATAKAQAP
jgi:hypothetical protein